MAINLFADDIAITTDNLENLQQIMNKITELLPEMELEINYAKTELFSNKYAHEAEDRIQITADGNTIHSKPPDTAFKYLGVFLTTSGNPSIHQQYVINKTKTALDKIAIHKLPIEQATMAINTIIIPKITYGAECLTWSNIMLDKLDSIIVQGYNKITHIKRSNIGKQFVFAPKTNGGCGVTQPKSIIMANSIYHLLQVANSKVDKQLLYTTERRLLDIQSHNKLEYNPILHNNSIKHKTKRNNYITHSIKFKNDLKIKFKTTEQRTYKKSILGVNKHTPDAYMAATLACIGLVYLDDPRWYNKNELLLLMQTHHQSKNFIYNDLCEFSSLLALESKTINGKALSKWASRITSTQEH